MQTFPHVSHVLERYPILTSCCAIYAALYWANGKAITRPGPFGPRWLAVLVARLFSAIMTYVGRCPVRKLVLPQPPFDPTRQHMVVWHPHGPYTTMAFMKCAIYTTTATPLEWYPGIAPFLFKLPLFREALLLLNARSCDYRTMDSLAAAGLTIGLQPGGIPEQLEADHAQDTAIFPARLGFIRMAMRYGMPLLPVYIFGENQAYTTCGKWGRTIAHMTYRLTGAPLVPILGLWGLPWLVPKPTNVSVCWGRPVPVGPPNTSPTDQDVHNVFERYVSELQRVFDLFKDECLPSEVAAVGLKISLGKSKL